MSGGMHSGSHIESEFQRVGVDFVWISAQRYEDLFATVHIMIERVGGGLASLSVTTPPCEICKLLMLFRIRDPRRS